LQISKEEQFALEQDPVGYLFAIFLVYTLSVVAFCLNLRRDAA
jgi:hypothetical protein